MSETTGGIDLGRLGGTEKITAKYSTSRTAGSADLGMTDFLQLIVAQFQNQDPSNAASTADMMNQMVQMSVVQAVTNITDATTMMYAASLVGKEVTVGQVGADGKIEELVGTVEATGTYGGKQVIFINGKSYYLNEIMAVGRLPEIEKPEDPPKVDNSLPGEGDGTEDPPKVDNSLPGEDGGGEAGDGTGGAADGE